MIIGLFELSARCDEVRGSRASSYVGRGRRATCLVASEDSQVYRRDTLH